MTSESIISAKYFLLLSGVVGLFANFVACGSQMYQVSLQGDTEVHGVQEPFVENDPSSENYGLHAPNGWSKLPVRFKVGQDITLEQRQGLMVAMATWELAVGKKLFAFEGVHIGVTGDSFKDLYGSLNDRVNGHYLDFNWQKTKKPNVVLATTIWDNQADDARTISSSDIRFNSEYYIFGDSLLMSNLGDGREVVDMQTLALHELGHMLGLAHIDQSVDAYSIMSHSLYIGEGLSNRHLSYGDVHRIQRIYGCANGACDIETVLARIEVLNQGQKEEEEEVSVTVESAH